MLVQAHEKARPALQCQTSHGENYSTHSIPRLSLELELCAPESYGKDSFTGSVRVFRVYLKAQRKLIEVGIIA